MLDVIGAGATATSSVDWHEKWLHSSEAVQVQQQLDELHSEGRKRPAVQASIQSDFATSWAFQLITLIGRGFTSYWRNPYYLLAKLVLNIVAGILVGFTFFKANSSIQGTQDKLFVSLSLYSSVYHPGLTIIVALGDLYGYHRLYSRLQSATSHFH